MRDQKVPFLDRAKIYFLHQKCFCFVKKPCNPIDHTEAFKILGPSAKSRHHAYFFREKILIIPISKLELSQMKNMKMLLSMVEMDF